MPVDGACPIPTPGTEAEPPSSGPCRDWGNGQAGCRGRGRHIARRSVAVSVPPCRAAVAMLPKCAPVFHIGLRAADGTWRSVREGSGERITYQRTIRNRTVRLLEDISSGQGKLPPPVVHAPTALYRVRIKEEPLSNPLMPMPREVRAKTQRPTPMRAAADHVFTCSVGRSPARCRGILGNTRCDSLRDCHDQISSGLFC